MLARVQLCVVLGQPPVCSGCVLWHATKDERAWVLWLLGLQVHKPGLSGGFLEFWTCSTVHKKVAGCRASACGCLPPLAQEQQSQGLGLLPGLVPITSRLHAGVSNLVTGLTGAGFTGSYIFSQTIFSMRAGVATRIHGLIIAGSEFALFALPISIVQYLPVSSPLRGPVC